MKALKKIQTQRVARRERELSKLYPPQNELLITGAIVRITINQCLPWPSASHYAQTCGWRMSASIAICHVNAAASEWAGTCMVSRLCVFFFFFVGDIYFLLEMLIRSLLWVVNLPFSSVICEFCDDNIVFKVWG